MSDLQLAKDTFKVLDRLYVEAINGVVCTPPNTATWNDPFHEGPHTGSTVDVDAPTTRMWCGSCKSIWREVMDLRARCGKELGYAEFRDTE